MILFVIYLHKNTVLANSTFESTKFVLYPNPATNELTIESKTAIESVSITNMLGQNVLNSATSNAIEVVDISNLQSGVYLIKVASEGQTSTKRFVKN